MPALVDIALLARHTFKAEDRFLKAGSAFITVRIGKALGVCTIDAAGTASTAAVLVPVVVTAVPAFHTVLVIGKHSQRKSSEKHYATKQY